MNIENESLPDKDDVQVDGQTEQDLLDAVMANSPIMDELGIPLPEEGEEVPDPAESDEVDPEAEEVVSEEEEEVEEVEEGDETEDAAEAATQDVDVFTADDLDLDAQVTVKVDGEEMNVSFGDLIKGYQTDAHLSKQGRELGEARKQLEEERQASLEQITEVAEATSQVLLGAEQNLAKQYHAIEEQIAKARKDGDTYEMNELKDKREQIQKSYGIAKKRREDIMGKVKEQTQKVQQEQWEKQIEHFQEKIPELIPDFDDKVAKDIRQFAIDEGMPEELIDIITDPFAIKMLDDYRRLKQNVSKGTAKRKAASTKKVPAKKPTPAKKKAQDRQKTIRDRALREDASEDDQMEFLRSHASRSLNM